MEMLPDGCTAFDCPEIANRVFHHKLQAYLKMLKTGSAWGPQTLEHATQDGKTEWKYGVSKEGVTSGFIIHVIEFQARGLPHAHIVFRPASMPEGSEQRGGREVGSDQSWADAFVCARKPTLDVLVEYGMLTSETEVAPAITGLSFREKARLFPFANLHPARKLDPTAADVQYEMQRLVTGTRKSMDGYGTFKTRGPMEHGPHPGNGRKGAHFCKKHADGTCKVRIHVLEEFELNFSGDVPAGWVYNG